VIRLDLAVIEKTIATGAVLPATSSVPVPVDEAVSVTVPKTNLAMTSTKYVAASVPKSRNKHDQNCFPQVASRKMLRRLANA